jgi:uncharacterized peroxidase-related enzyme
MRSKTREHRVARTQNKTGQSMVKPAPVPSRPILSSPGQSPRSKAPRYDKSKTDTAKTHDSRAAAIIPAAAENDDVTVIALSLPIPQLNESMSAYFKKCEEKLGFVPNVLKAYAFDMAKLEAFVAMYNDLMLAPSGLSKLEREMIAVAVSSHNKCYYCLVAHGAAVRQMANDPVLGEVMAMNYRAARLSKRHRAMLDFAVKLTAEPWAIEDHDRDALRRAGFADRDIWDISAVAGFFNMSNRVAAATDMRPNSAYHAQAR